MNWRCDTCSRLSNAAVKPRHHIRDGKPCPGPFSAVQIAAEGAVLAPAGAVVASRPAIQRPTTYRQSLLRSFEICARRALHELAIPNDISVGNVGSSADLGSASHAVLVEILNTLKREGFSIDEHGRRHVVEQLSTQEGVEVMYEVLAGGEWVLTAEDRDTLREFVLVFCSSPKYRWPPGRIVSLERRLSLDLPCPDGVTRTLTGQPDVVLSDAPDGLIVVDFKTGRGQPTTPRPKCVRCGEGSSHPNHRRDGSCTFTPPSEDDAIVGRQYLSEGGTYQLDIYGLLVLKGRTEDGYLLAPRARRVTLREAWLRFGERREATLGYEELEHVEREIAVQMMLLDRAIDEGADSGTKLTNPRPGRQCLRSCPVSASCQIPDEQRGEGAIQSPDDADENARRWVKLRAVDKTLRERLKAWHEETGHCPDVGDGTQIRWQGEKGSRNFGAHPPAKPREPVPDCMPQWEAELERQQAKAGVA